MRMAGLVCGIHIWWGASLVVGIPVPRPFGALEPFFAVSENNLIVGLILLISGLLPLIFFYWPKGVWCISCAMIPQQLVLCWGFLAGLADVAVLHDGRSWYALGYTGMLFFFHGWDLCDKFIVEIIRQRQSIKGNQSSDGQ